MTSDYRLSHLNKGDKYDKNIEKDAFDSFMAIMEERWLMKIIRDLFPIRIDTYLDFACGTGRITCCLEKFANYSCGVDISNSMLQSAIKKCSHTEFFELDLTKNESVFDGRKFDLITAFRFLGNAQDELRNQALSSIRRLIKKDGYLIVNNHRNPAVPRNKIAKFLGGQDKMDLSRPKLQSLLMNNGFRVEKEIGIGFWLIHYKLDRMGIIMSNIMSSPFNVPMLARLCPDTIFVLRPY